MDLYHAELCISCELSACMAPEWIGASKRIQPQIRRLSAVYELYEQKFL